MQGSPHFTCKGMEFRELNRFVLGLHRWGVIGCCPSALRHGQTTSSLWPQCHMPAPCVSLQGLCHLRFHTLASSLHDFQISQGVLRWNSCPELSGAFNDTISSLIKNGLGTRDREEEGGEGEERADKRGEKKMREDTPWLSHWLRTSRNRPQAKDCTQHPKARRGQGPPSFWRPSYNYPLLLYLEAGAHL